MPKSSPTLWCGRRAFTSSRSGGGVNKSLGHWFESRASVPNEGQRKSAALDALHQTRTPPANALPGITRFNSIYSGISLAHSSAFPMPRTRIALPLIYPPPPMQTAVWIPDGDADEDLACGACGEVVAEGVSATTLKAVHGLSPIPITFRCPACGATLGIPE